MSGDDYFTVHDESASIPTISLTSGDRVISTLAWDSVYAYPVKSEGFGNFSSPNTNYWSELNGIDLEASGREVEDVLSELGIRYGSETGYYFVSDAPRSVTFGFYEGTKFKEQTLAVDKPYFQADTDDTVWNLFYGKDSRKELVQNKTKEGYFTVDLSSFPQGRYVLRYTAGSGNYKFWAFDIA